MKQILDMYILSLGLLVLGLATLLIGIALLFWSLTTSLLALVDIIRSLYIIDSIESPADKKEYASWMGSSYGTMKGLFSAVAFFGVTERIGGKIEGGSKGIKILMNTFSSLQAIDGVLNIFSANYPSYVRDRLTILSILLISFLILGRFVPPVAIGLAVYSLVNALLFSAMLYFAWQSD